MTPAELRQDGFGLLAFAEDTERPRERLGEALWAAGGFLANGAADGPHAARQPITVSNTCKPVNEAQILVLADGTWREEATALERVMLLFGEEATDAARNLWRELAPREDIDNRIFKQTPEGGWREGR